MAEWMAVEIISCSISTKVWDRAGIELVTPGSAVRHVSAARHVTDYTTCPGGNTLGISSLITGIDFIRKNRCLPLLGIKKSQNCI